MFEYEHTSKFNVSAETRGSLVREIEGDEFHLSPIQGKIMLNDIEKILDNHIGSNLKEVEIEFIKHAEFISEEIIQDLFKDLQSFIFTDPKIPVLHKKYVNTNKLNITNKDSREKIMDLIVRLKDKSELARLSLYVFRQMDKIDWLPFIKAGIERNPVCFTDLNGKNNSEVYHILKNMPDESIYDGKRMALPDEVWNFRRGDGVEKALLLADFLIKKNNSSTVSIKIENKNVLLTSDGMDFHFTSHKDFRKSILITGTNYEIV
jgi:hypothetical protein